eukprot:SAG11_NODE_4174_length_2027_cov_2.128631_1_plen_119_part_00
MAAIERKRRKSKRSGARELRRMDKNQDLLDEKLSEIRTLIWQDKRKRGGRKTHKTRKEFATEDAVIPYWFSLCHLVCLLPVCLPVSESHFMKAWYTKDLVFTLPESMVFRLHGCRLRH